MTIWGWALVVPCTGFAWEAHFLHGPAGISRQLGALSSLKHANDIESIAPLQSGRERAAAARVWAAPSFQVKEGGVRRLARALPCGRLATGWLQKLCRTLAWPPMAFPAAHGHWSSACSIHAVSCVLPLGLCAWVGSTPSPTLIPGQPVRLCPLLLLDAGLTQSCSRFPAPPCLLFLLAFDYAKRWVRVLGGKRGDGAVTQSDMRSVD